MNTLPLITQLFALIASGSMIWLIIRAFKTHPGWGFAVLLLSPVSAIVFGVKYWDKQRQPFLLYVTTLTATLVLGIYVITVSGGKELLHFSANFQQGMQGHKLARYSNGELRHASFSSPETSATDGMFREDPDFLNGHASTENAGLVDAETQTRETAGSNNKPAMKNKKSVRYRLSYIPIDIAEIKKHIGTTAKITRKNAEEKEYLITGASPKHIELAQRSKHGKYSFHFKNSDIENIRVLVKQPY